MWRSYSLHTDPTRGPIGEAPLPGLLRSRPVSRILSRVTIHLCGYPAPRRAVLAEPVRLAPDGVWRAGRVATVAGGLLPHRFTLTADVLRRSRRTAVCFLCHFPSAFAASLAGASCPAVSGLSSSLEARGHPACDSHCSPVEARWLNRIPHSGQWIDAGSCSTNSPQTGHSRLAPRRSAVSSCSSVRWRGATV